MASTAPHLELNQRFEIPGTATIVQGHGGLPCVRVTTPRASGEVYLHGAHVTSWKPAEDEEALFVSSKTRWQDGSAIRGGVPVCFPWFSERAEDAKSPAHGLVRTKSWQLEAITHADNNVTVALSTSADEATRKYWQGEFRVLFCVTFGEQLRLELIVANRGDLSFRFEGALHSYYRVGNAPAAKLHGLSGVTYIDKTDGRKEKHQRGDLVLTGETDRIYRNTSAPVEIEDPALRRRVVIAKEGSRDTVVWNPWTDKAKAMSDLGSEEWRQFVCVETGNVGDHGIVLGEGQTHTMAALVSLNEI